MDERINEAEPAPQDAQREAEPPTRFRYVLWSHASHDLPPSPRGRRRAARRDEGGGQPDGTMATDDINGTREPR